MQVEFVVKPSVIEVKCNYSDLEKVLQCPRNTEFPFSKV